MNNIFCQVEYETIIEEFTSDATGWVIYDNTDQKVSISDGNYVLQNKSTSKIVNGLKEIAIDPNYDYSIEAKMIQTSGLDSYEFGLVWGYKNGYDFLKFVIKSNGMFAIYRKGKESGSRTYISEWKKAKKKTISKIGKPNILKVEKNDKGISYFINNNKVFTSEHYNVIGTRIGVVLNEEMSVNVDYVKVKRKKRVIKLVDNPINGYKLENLGDKINGKSTETGPLLSYDGKTLYFVRSDHPENVGNPEKQDIWYSNLNKNGEWEDAKNVGTPLNNSKSNYAISITPDGNSLLVGGTYNSDGSWKGNGISMAQKRNGKWQVPQKVEITYTNTNMYNSFFLTPDGTKLILSIQNDESFGDQDLFISFLKKDGSWTKPINMGNVLNTYHADFAPFLAADGKTMYFSSYGHAGYGSADIFVSRRLDDTWTNWSEPLNLGPEINSLAWDADFTISASGDYAYMVSYDKNISKGSGDIFRIKLGESVKPDPIVLTTGMVYDKKTNKPLNAEIVYENLESGNREGIAYSTIEDGFKISLPKGSVYGFRAIAPNYYPVSENIDLKNLKNYEEKEVILYLVPIETGQTIRLNNIFFDFGKATLTPESYPELNRLVELMQLNKDMKIEIAGHTDNKGSDEFNLNLSRERAKAVREYLIEKNIDGNRITSNGYGKSKPVATNDTDEGRQLNRRVEFIIQ